MLEKNMDANVQSGHMVTCAKSNKPKETLWYKGLGSRIFIKQYLEWKDILRSCTNLLERL